jgi:hypothetical protein
MRFLKGGPPDINRYNSNRPEASGQPPNFIKPSFILNSKNLLIGGFLKGVGPAGIVPKPRDSHQLY